MINNKKAGRPRKYKKGNEPYSVSIRLTPDERKFIEKNHGSISAFVKEALKNSMRKVAGRTKPS